MEAKGVTHFAGFLAAPAPNCGTANCGKLLAMRLACAPLIFGTLLTSTQQPAAPKPVQPYQLSVKSDKPEQMALSPSFVAKVREFLGAIDQLEYERSGYNESNSYMKGKTTTDRLDAALFPLAKTDAEVVVTLAVDGLRLSKEMEATAAAYPEIHQPRPLLIDAAACRKLIISLLDQGRAQPTFGPCNIAPVPRPAVGKKH